MAIEVTEPTPAEAMLARIVYDGHLRHEMACAISILFFGCHCIVQQAKDALPDDAIEAYAEAADRQSAREEAERSGREAVG